jgi:capsular exopolysaccharide synthesis family protein
MNAKKRSYHTLRDFFFVIFKQKTFIITFSLLVLCFAAISFFVMTPVYEASSKLVVKNSGGNAGYGPSGEDSGIFSGNIKNESTVATAVEILSGRFLAEKVIKKLGAKTIYPGMDKKTFLGKLSGREKAILKFKKNLEVTKGNIIEVSFLHPDSFIAAKVVNTLIEEFLDHYLAVQKRDQKYDFFKNQADLIGKRLQESQKELGLFRNQNNISSIQKQKSLLLLQVSDLEVEIAKTRSQISEQESIAAGAKNPSSSFKEIQQRLNSLNSKAKKLQQHVTQYKLELGRLDKAETRLSELERQVKMDEENYLLYTQKMEEARIASAMDEQKIINFSVIEPALPPITPGNPQKNIIIILSVILGCVGGLILAFVFEYFTHTFDHREDIEEILGCTAIASFAEMTGAEAARIKEFKISEKALEKCNRMKHYFHRTFADRENKMIVFCASKKNEGTSSTLLKLAVTLAAEGERVLAVDANLRNPCLHSLLKAERANGLLDVIVEKTPVENVIKNTAIENLRLITSGTSQANPSAALQSENFDSFVQEIKTMADWVLIDSPSVDFYGDACVIAPKTDGAALVVKAGKTRWEVVASAVNRLKQSDAKIVGAVLNRQKMYIPGWLYNRL